MPSYTLFGTVQHSFMKKWTLECLKSWSEQSSVANHWFENQRPELFALVSKRTCTQLTIDFHGKSCGHIRLGAFNHIFRTLFDTEIIEKYPIKAFLPWRTIPNKDYGSRKILAKLYEEDKNCLFLLKIRPKLNVGFEDKFNHYHYIYLIDLICREGHKTPIIAKLEPLLPEVGFDLILHCGYTLKTTTGDIYPEDSVKLFNFMLKQKNYDTSGFVTAAELYANSAISKKDSIDDLPKTSVPRAKISEINIE